MTGAVLNNRLYVAGEEGIGRWNEETQAWEYLMKGLPTGSHSDPDDPPWVSSLAVNRGRLFCRTEWTYVTGQARRLRL